MTNSAVDEKFDHIQAKARATDNPQRVQGPTPKERNGTLAQEIWMNECLDLRRQRRPPNPANPRVRPSYEQPTLLKQRVSTLPKDSGQARTRTRARPPLALPAFASMLQPPACAPTIQSATKSWLLLFFLCPHQQI